MQNITDRVATFSAGIRRWSFHLKPVSRHLRCRMWASDKSAMEFHSKASTANFLAIRKDLYASASSVGRLYRATPTLTSTGNVTLHPQHETTRLQLMVSRISSPKLPTVNVDCFRMTLASKQFLQLLLHLNIPVKDSTTTRSPREWVLLNVAPTLKYCSTKNPSEYRNMRSSSAHTIFKKLIAKGLRLDLNSICSRNGRISFWFVYFSTIRSIFENISKNILYWKRLTSLNRCRWVICEFNCPTNKMWCQIFLLLLVILL